MADRYLKPLEAADIMRTSVNTLKWQRHVGVGPAYVKHGRRVLYREADVIAYLEAGLRVPGPSAA